MLYFDSQPKEYRNRYTNNPKANHPLIEVHISSINPNLNPSNHNKNDDNSLVSPTNNNCKKIKKLNTANIKAETYL